MFSVPPSCINASLRMEEMEVWHYKLVAGVTRGVLLLLCPATLFEHSYFSGVFFHFTLQMLGKKKLSSALHGMTRLKDQLPTPVNHHCQHLFFLFFSSFFFLVNIKTCWLWKSVSLRLL